MKLPRLITRRRVKWVGTICCAVLLALYIGSYWVILFGIWNSPTIGRIAYLGRGQIGATIKFDQGDRRLYDSSGIYVEIGENIEMLALKFTFGFGTGQPVGPHVWTWMRIPLWIPLLLLAAPTAWFWYTDRRAKPWQCPKCRYDLRGLDGGVCPECGTPIAERTE